MKKQQSSSSARGFGPRSRTSADATKENTPSVQSKSNRTVWSIRLIFLFFLIVAACILGFLAHYIVKGSEEALAEQQYEALAARALSLAEDLTVRRRVVGESMAKVAASAFPEATMWPNVAIPSFQTFAQDLIDTSATVEIGFYPLVQPEQIYPGEQEAFEDFAYDYFYVQRSPPFPNGTAVKNFGRGISGHWSGHDTHGRTNRWDSPNRILVPLLQSSLGDSIRGRLKLMNNIHSHQRYGEPIDDVIACAKERKVTRNLEMDCGAETRIFSTSRFSFLMQPIYPARDLFELTGVIVSKVSHDIVVAKMFEGTAATGLTAVLESEGKSYTFGVEDGKAAFRDDDLRDTGLYRYGRKRVLSGTSSRQYSVTLYPTKEFFDIYSTDNPTFAMVGAVIIVIATSIVFCTYDCVVRREFSAKQELLQAKRKFVRFISHEVRTPLNAVGMGLTLLQDEIKGLLKKREADGEASFGRISRSSPPAAGRMSRSSSGSSSSKVDSDLSTWLSLLEDIHGSSSSAVGVLSDMLNLDKAESGGLSLELTVFSIWGLIMETAKEFRSVASKKTISFELDNSALLECGEGEKPSRPDGGMMLPSKLQHGGVVGDRIRITQVLENLISSALTFTPEGGNVTIRTTFLEPESNGDQEPPDYFTLNSGEEVTYNRIGLVQIDVIDSGPGLSPEQLAVIGREGIEFDVNELRTGQGCSLGLFLSKGIVLQHGGRMKVSSEGLGCGSTFSCLLPLYNVPDVITEAGPIPSGPVEECSSSRGIEEEEEEALSLHVLVVDDVATNRKLLARLVRNHGHSTVEAKDGREAVDKAVSALQEGNPFDSILLDWEMPELSGPEASKQIRELGCNFTFIVGITGNVSKEDADYFISCGANAVLPKPVDMKKLEKLWLGSHLKEVPR